MFSNNNKIRDAERDQIRAEYLGAAKSMAGCNTMMRLRVTMFTLPVRINSITLRRIRALAHRWTKTILGYNIQGYQNHVLAKAAPPALEYDVGERQRR